VDLDHHEFEAVREAAYHGLRSGSFVGDAGLPLCRFVVLPSFHNAIAWDVRSLRVRGKSAESRLFRSCWRRDLDLQALGSPVERLKHPRPYRATVEVASVSIDPADIGRLIRRFQSTPIPLAIAKPPVGLDGTSYELKIGGPFCRAQITWWVRLPEEWAALAPLIDEMAALFESSWRDASPDAAVDPSRPDNHAI
jgi:hypothetical protein